MFKLAVYGKGGIGKSTITGNLSACFAEQNLRVLHIGCDPKSDSTRLLLGYKRPKTVASRLLIQGARLDSLEDLIEKGFLGVDCLESGGPEPGIGCGGWAIAKMAGLLISSDLVKKRAYDVILFDVLGDVVCGGFAAPMRKGFADRVAIVVSEEIMSLFAANNICRAVVRLKDSGPRLAGFVINRRNNLHDLALVREFIGRLGSRVLETIPRDPLVEEAEKQGVPLMVYAPGSESAARLRELSRTLAALTPAELLLPSPMSDEDFFSFIRQAG